MAVLMTAAPLSAEAETLIIRGDGVEKEITYSRADLEGLATAIERHCYSVTNNFPTDKTEYAAGVELLYLLQEAGLKDTAQLITFIASDGYRREFTVQELLFTPRYYFPPSKEKAAVPTIICLQSSAKGFDTLESTPMKLIMGQRASGEQTNPWFVKYLAEIEVSCKKPARWAEVTFNRVAGSEGVTLQLLHENIDAVKIYYTTDGSIPTVESNMYNLSASYYQPELNQPLLINETVLVQAVAVGAGKEDSALAAVLVSLDGALFSDLTGYDWARSAIEELAAKKIITGVGDYRFDPAGNLTRAMFVTMLGRALNQDTIATPLLQTERFSDVDYHSWYGAHVQWAVDGGIISGYPDGTFKPNHYLTIEEMIVMAVRAGGLEPGTMAENSVLTGVSDWAEPYIMIAENHHMLLREHLARETEDGIMVEGERNASRAEAAALLRQLLLSLS